MKCYLDYMFYELMEIGYNENFSYYGKNQGHYPIKIEEGVYIGMRANIILKYSLDDGGVLRWEECIKSEQALL